MVPSLRLRSRHLLLAALCVLTFLFLVRHSSPSSSWSATSPQLESYRLERFMNTGEPAKPAPTMKSSFDWSKVKYEFPPTRRKSLPSGRAKTFPPVQHKFAAESPEVAKKREARRQQVKKLFQKNWKSYKRYAWKKDALMPLTATYKDQFSGWAATLVDSLDTLWIMGLREEFDEAVAAVAEVDFGQSTTGRVNMFETTIRYLGGLLAAYDLSGRQVLLNKAIELGDLLYAGFNSENRMPVDNLDVDSAKRGNGLVVEGNVVSAAPGTLSMEMTRLSQVTGDPKYYEAIDNVMRLFHRHQSETQLPGMWPIWVSMSRGDVVNGESFTLGGSADSLYEYLPKMHALLGGREPIYEEMSKAFMATAEEKLFFRPMLPGGENILISGNVRVDSDNNTILDPESEHLTCFIGGVFALAGQLFNQPGDVDTGGKLARGCAYVYRAFPTGIMPERYNMVPCESRRSCQWDESKWEAEKERRAEYKPHLPKGFTTAKDPRYLLRPEAIESVFILWRITGKQWYQEAAWDMFVAVSNGTATDYANAAVKDVTIKSGELEKEDYMESFWLAETLKYFYLVFSPPDVISLDHYVLNTEAHPFKRPK